MTRQTPGWIGIAGLVSTLLVLSGCGGKSSLLLERQMRGPISEEPGVAKPFGLRLDPIHQTQTQSGVTVAMTHASSVFLQEFFSNEELFGGYAGINPFFPEQLVFYIRMTNESGQKIYFNPAEFVLVDDRGSQYRTLETDYTTELADAKRPVMKMTRDVIGGARPGYFGIGIPVGKMFGGGKPQRQFALLSRASLLRGFLHDGVEYDGFVAFWNPHEDATVLKLLLTDVKTDFNANDWPQRKLEFAFELRVVPQGTRTE